MISRLRFHADGYSLHSCCIWFGALLLAGCVTSSALSQEVAWHDPAEMFDAVDQSCVPGSCTDLGCEPEPRGTLFLWPGHPEETGGPDLNEPLVTDRPDFTEASVTVGRGVLQLESGYTYLLNNDDGVQEQAQTFGEFLFRYGVFADWMELRLAVTPVEARERAGGVSESTAGMSDLYLGAKFALTPQAGWLPEMAIMPQMFVPVGSPNLSSDQIEPGVNWLYSWDLTDNISLGGSTQVNRRLDEDGTSYAQFADSLSLGFSLTDELGMYTEWFAFFPDGANAAQVEHYFDGGFTYLITEDIQWDIRAGAGLNDAAADYFVGMGLSIRFR